MGYGNGGTVSGAGHMTTMETRGGAPPQMLGLPQTFEEQGKLIVELRDALLELERRLTMLLAPMPPSADTNAKQEQPGGFVARMQGYNQAIGGARAHVVSLLERLQL